MSEARWSQFGRLVDLLTVCLGLAAVWLAFQPRSLLRTRLDTAAADRRTIKAAARNWEGLRKDAIAQGASSAASLIVFTDYNCEFCRAMEPSLDSLIADGHAIALVLVPRKGVRMASDAAIAALCAREQDGFRTMHTRLMASEEWRKSGDVFSFARSVGVRDSTAFAECVDSGRHSGLLESMRALSDSLGVGGTPTIVSPRAVRRGLSTTEELRAMFDSKGT